MPGRATGQQLPSGFGASSGRRDGLPLRAGVSGRRRAAARDSDALLRQPGQLPGARTADGAPAASRGYPAGPGRHTEQIKRANRLYTNDSIFLKKNLLIPVPTKPKALSNGLNFEEEEEEEEEKAGEALPSESTKKQKQPRKNGSSGGSVPKHDLSAADFLFKLDSEIRRSKQAAVKKLREGESGILGEAAGVSPTPSTSGSYQGESSPRSQQRVVLGPVPLTRIARADALLDQEDEIFKL
ncbi:lysM and putative peptidoglycan-binding domain-containing protein 1 isoform X1 [Crotalus tigris]|uniref:lysM and putative peptidoglycan-binding domain-containing protein 1 isoform X1 n=1 Tax=Crotalus tigris TaxID=88082 RepID=UPI00192F8521|nr:lysM and putative peptidoglycan-binding domain-containing protein 1 isoform X1 [Crotalus tigris]